MTSLEPSSLNPKICLVVPPQTTRMSLRMFKGRFTGHYSSVRTHHGKTLYINNDEFNRRFSRDQPRKKCQNGTFGDVTQQGALVKPRGRRRPCLGWLRCRAWMGQEPGKCLEMRDLHLEYTYFILFQCHFFILFHRKMMF